MTHQSRLIYLSMTHFLSISLQNTSKTEELLQTEEEADEFYRRDRESRGTFF